MSKLLTLEEFERERAARKVKFEQARQQLAEEIGGLQRQLESRTNQKTVELDAFDSIIRPNEPLDMQSVINELDTIAKELAHLTRVESILQSAFNIQSSMYFVLKLKRYIIIWCRERINKSISNLSMEDTIEAFKELLQISIRKSFKGLIAYHGDCSRWAQEVIDAFFSNAFSEQLETLGWPKEIKKFDTKKLEALLGALDNYILFAASCKDANIYDRICRVMLRPIKLRFKFHYATDRPTNRLDKPEWYLLHFYQLADSHEKIIKEVFELDVPHQQQLGLFDTFVRGLLSLIREHLAERREQIQSDSFILMHTVSEIFKFIKLLNDRFDQGSALLTSNLLLDALWTNPADMTMWIDAQHEATFTSLRTILEEFPAWNQIELVPDPSSCPLIDDVGQLLRDLHTTLHSLPCGGGVKIEFLNAVVRPVLETIYEKIDFEIPSFHNSLADVHVLIVQANSLSQLIDLLKEDLGELPESIEFAASKEYQDAFGSDASKLAGSIFHRSIRSFQELLLDRIIREGLEAYLWDKFYTPASSFARSMHYGITRSSTVAASIGMHDDLRKAMVSLSEAFTGVIPFLRAPCSDVLQSSLLFSSATFVFDKFIMQNYFRREHIGQLRTDYKHLLAFLLGMMPSHPVEMAMQRSSEAVAIICLSEDERVSLLEAIEDDDLDRVAELLQGWRIHSLSVSHCERLLSLVKD